MFMMTYYPYDNLEADNKFIIFKNTMVYDKINHILLNNGEKYVER